jgi:hypothetical protein
MRGHLGENLAVVGYHPPQSQAAGAVNMAAIPLSPGSQTMFVVGAGVLGASATLDLKIQGATSAGGTYADIPGAAITQLVKASHDNNLAVFVIDNSAIANLGLGYTHIRGVVTVGAAASLVTVIAIQGRLVRSDAGDFDLAAVREIRALVN